jgi:CHAD domain-containing protein
MLAERGQMMTTEWTAIRRRLPVRRSANRPPWGGRKSGHASIVAPLAATIAATVAVGVGVALARVERDRRATSRRRRRERRFRLLAGEPLGEGLRRAARGQLGIAIELLESADGEASGAKMVHETRKAFKRVRALLRLLKDELGIEAFTRENALVRDVSLRLAAARDAEVLLRTLDDLLRRHPGRLAHRRGVSELRARLLRECELATRSALGDRAARTQGLAELHMLRDRVSSWRLCEGTGIEALEPALSDLYRQGRNRRRRAARGSGERTRAMHAWRKRVKDLRYVAELLNIGGVARRADELGELLGEEHDLALLAARVRTEAERSRAEGRTGPTGHKPLLKLIARRRRRLRRRALADGKRLFRHSPRKFARRARKATKSDSLSRR